MDADGLPLVGPGVDYTKVEAIQQKRTIAFLNHFITHTARFLNRFSCVCEEKLEQMSNRIQQLEITMNMLETKLSSIPGLENVTAASSTTNQDSATSTTTSTATPTATPTPTQGPPTATSQPPPPDEAGPPPVPVEEEKVQNPVSKDPRYARFFKMLQVGVPEPAVKTKMRTEGLNPDLLDTPDAPAPPAEEKKDDSDSDFGDSDDSSMSD